MKQLPSSQTFTDYLPDIMYLRTCAKQIMINLVIISKSNSNESLSQIKAEASMLIVVFYLLNG